MVLSLWPAASLAHDPAEAPRKDEPRVKAARAEQADTLRRLYAAANVAYPPRALLLRVFKLDDVLEVWALPAKGERYVLVESIPVCARSGGPGPKRREGDLQVPEGYYRISAFNPWSNFLLSMKVDYPNAADRKRSSAPRLGGDIFIHGSCVTIGCVPLGDEAISRLYVSAQDTAHAGGRVDAHLYPARLDAAHQAALIEAAAGDAALLAFWDQLRPGYAWFEARRTLPRVKIDGAGRYVTATD